MKNNSVCFDVDGHTVRMTKNRPQEVVTIIDGLQVPQPGDYLWSQCIDKFIELGDSDPYNLVKMYIDQKYPKPSST